ncbi:MAG: hypothetical protein AB7H43_13435 [Acidimicrobiia bacterium]
MWLPGFEVIPNRLGKGGSYDDAPWRLVVHTTEVVPSTLSGARDMAARHDAPPHLWVWPERGWRAQTVPLHRSAFALRRPKRPLSPPTNTRRAIQVEVIGRAGEALSWPDTWWDWLGTDVVAPVAAAIFARFGEVLNLHRVAETTGPFGYGTDGEVRMTWDDWAGFDGICGHANVPGNEHWDPGHADLHRVAATARRALTPSTVEGDASVIAKDDNDARHAQIRQWICAEWGREPTPDEKNLRVIGLVEHGADHAYAEIRDHEHAQQFRARRGW